MTVGFMTVEVLDGSNSLFIFLFFFLFFVFLKEKWL